LCGKGVRKGFKKTDSKLIISLYRLRKSPSSAIVTLVLKALGRGEKVRSRKFVSVTPVIGTATSLEHGTITTIVGNEP